MQMHVVISGNQPQTRYASSRPARHLAGGMLEWRLVGLARGSRATHQIQTVLIGAARAFWAAVGWLA